MKKQDLLFKVPDLMTIVNLVLGFTAIVQVVESQFRQAALFILLAILLDVSDGFFARILRSESKIGAELDSLADLVSFGVAPGILAHTYLLDMRGSLIVASLIPVCGAIRLARYNIMHDRTYFTGLPIPAVGGLIASLVFINYRFESIHIMILLVLLASMMVSEVKYPRFKRSELRKPSLSFIIAALSIIPPLVDRSMIVVPFAAYFILGLLSEIGSLKNKLRAKAWDGD